MNRFQGRVALVTGATRGIGQAVAVRLAAEGAVVAVNHRESGDPGETLRQIKSVGGEGFPVMADMRQPDQVVELVQETAKLGGRLDYCVSNAAVNPQLTWSATTLEDWNLISDTNIRGTWVVCTEAAKQMIAEGHGGAIVCVSSISATVATPDQTAYCASKAAVSMLATALGLVLGPHGIRVNSVSPGVIRTDMIQHMTASPELLRHYAQSTPLKRIGEPAEVARAIAFLLSEEASYVTSANLLVDAGLISNNDR